MDSGGILTERTGDYFGRALERVFRRTACSYSLGIEDEGPREDRRKSVTVWLKRKDLRAVHAAAYVLRSEEAKRESLLRAAYLAPGLFDTGTVRALLLPLRPASASLWKGQLAVGFPVRVSPAPESGRGIEFGIVLSRGSEVIHRAHRSLRLEPSGGTSPHQATVTFLEPLDVPPGKYTVSVVLSDPAAPAPRSVQVEVELPDVPHGELFLVGPLLGRRAGADLLIRSAGSDPGSGAPRSSDKAGDAIGKEGSFEPLLAPRLNEPSDVVVLTQACTIGAWDGVAAPVITRSLRSASGPTIGQLEPVHVTLDGTGEVRCGNLMDVLPAGALRPGTEYVFEADLDLGDGRSRAPSAARFSIAPAGGQGTEPQTTTP